MDGGELETKSHSPSNYLPGSVRHFGDSSSSSDLNNDAKTKKMEKDLSYKEKVPIPSGSSSPDNDVIPAATPRGLPRPISFPRSAKTLANDEAWLDLQTRHNMVVTSKYTAFNFLPKFLFEQLHPYNKFANFYFFVVCILQGIKSISITSGAPLTAGPLMFVLFVEAMNQIVEDLARHKADDVMNATPTKILRVSEGGRAQFVDAAWRDVKVGDVLKVCAREVIPADLMFLSGSDAEQPGVCFVNTKSLDGETDNKLRVAPSCFVEQGPVKTADDCAQIKGVLYAEAPNDVTSDFTGIYNGTGIVADNMLLRGCQLRNTEYVFGLVVSTGVDTKINFNPPGKKGKNLDHRPQSSKFLNRVLFQLVMLVFLSCFLGTVGYYSVVSKATWYLHFKGGSLADKIDELVKQFFTFFLLMYQLIPVSLYVTLTMVYTISRWFMERDLGMCDETQIEAGTLEGFAKVRNSELCDEIGQVQYVLSDKTGTLTSNLMEFQKCWIGGVEYGEGTTQIGLARLKRERDDMVCRTAADENVARALEEKIERMEQVREQTRRPRLDTEQFARIAPSEAKLGARYVNFKDGDGSAGRPNLAAKVASRDAAATRFMLNMSLNHTVLLENVNGTLELCASSSDEQAFVAAAANFGYTFHSRDLSSGSITLKLPSGGATEQYEIIQIIPYESSRKRMSVIVKSKKPGSSPILFCKGADSVIFERLAEGTNPLKGNLSKLLLEWAEDAFRTLVFASRKLTDAEVKAWLPRYHAASNDPEQKRLAGLGHPNDIDRLSDEMEKNLILDGASAVEDKLQEGVPRTLASLNEAGIAVWMITGDKSGTARNIAQACNLLNPRKPILSLTEESIDEMTQREWKQSKGASSLGDLKTKELGDVAVAIRSGVGFEDAIGRLEKTYPGLLRVRKMLREIASRTKMPSKLPSRWGVQTVPWFFHCCSIASSFCCGGTSTTNRDSVLRAESTGLPDDYDDENSKSSSDVEMALPPKDTSIDDVSEGYSMIFDEKIIDYALMRCKSDLLRVAMSSTSVVASRARKDQKQKLVELLREGIPGVVTLGIGDGANDVGMIKAANIGVGISGKEGRQAVNNSDFAICEFQHLEKLLLVWGRQNYRRMAVLVCYMFYKNIISAGTQFLYGVYSAWSSQKFYPEFGAQFFNITFTGIPIIMFTIFGFDIRATVAMAVPSVYRKGAQKQYLTRNKFWMWQLGAVYTAIIIAFVPANCLENIGGGSASEYSVTEGLWGLGGYCFTLAILITNMKLMVEMESWTIMDVIGFTLFGGLPPWIFFAVLFSYPTWFISWGSLGGYDWHGLLEELWSNPTFWFMFMLVPVICLAPDFLYKGYHRAFHHPPESSQVLQELVMQHGEERALEIVKRARKRSESARADDRRRSREER